MHQRLARLSGLRTDPTTSVRGLRRLWQYTSNKPVAPLAPTVKSLRASRSRNKAKRQTEPLSVDQPVLALVATPLQAVIWLAVCSRLKTEFDVLYSPQFDSEQHRHYFRALSDNSRRSVYCGPAAGRNWLSRTTERLVAMARLSLAESYRTLALASLDSSMFRLAVRLHPNASVLTFDDGTANIFDSPYLKEDRYPPSRLERLLRIPRPREVACASQAHFTIYEGFENVVSPERLHHVPLIPQTSGPGTTACTLEAFIHFIGAPYPELVQTGAMTDEEVGALLSWLESGSVDVYHPHPREVHPKFLGDSPRVSADPRIVEEKLLDLQGRANVTIIGLFSSALLNVPPSLARKIYVSLPNRSNESVRASLMRRRGCEVVEIYRLADVALPRSSYEPCEVRGSHQ